MAKKGGVQLQIEVDNEEAWDLLVEREGLILVDIYSEWCGPCSGMLGNLRKVKLEIGGETLILAAAKCDNIPCLERFRNKSRPTWMFISNQRMIRLMFGANAPKLISILTEEIKLTKQAIAAKTPRKGIDFEQLTEEEQAVADEEARIREEKERIERETRERAINERREEVAENLIEPLKDYNIIVTWPHVGNDGMAQIMTAVKETPMTFSGKPIKYHLKEEDYYEMLYYSSWEYSDIEKQELFKDPVTALLFEAPKGDDEEHDPIEIFLEKFYGVNKCPPGDEESLAVKISTIIKIKVEEPKPEEEEVVGEAPAASVKDLLAAPEHAPVAEPPTPRKSKKPSIPPASQRKSSAVEEENFIEVPIPGLYTPENSKCLALAMRILFPLITLKFDLPEPEPTPPHVICVYDAFKRDEILQLASEWPEGTMRFGFFTTADPATAKLIAKTAEQFSRLLVKPHDAKLIVQISTKKPEPLLSYSMLSPMYVSANTDVGEKECVLLFPEEYDVPDEEEPEPEVVVPKKKKKKGRGSQTTVETEESTLGEGGSEEGLEEEEVEDEEDEDAGDDDFDPSTTISFDIEEYREPTDIRLAVAAETPEAIAPITSTEVTGAIADVHEE